MAVDPKPTKTGELLAAYVDGVGEMDVEERRRVERYLAEPGAREEQAATRDLIDQLREIREPEPQVDWSAMERAIHAEVGDEVPKRSLWSRSPARLAAAFALAAAAAILFLVLRGEADEASPIVFVPKPPAQAEKKGDAWLADRIYSGVPAGTFGKEQEIEIGHYSGESNVIYWLKKRGYEPTKELVTAVFTAAKRGNRVLADHEVVDVIRDFQKSQ